jgi:1-pyrroline-5-carboxylate dehydrogenase
MTTSVSDRVTLGARPPFANEPVTDFSKPEHIRAQEAALRKVESEFGYTFPLVIGGQRRFGDETFTSLDPADPERVLAVFAKASVADAHEAVEAAWRRFQTWQYTPATERAGYLLKAAELLRQQRFYFNALMIYEVGKSWIEADADTAEAIDFLEFYAREALRLAGDQPITPIPGEQNELRYIPLGAGVAIPPWNFPCAIMVGLTSSALVAGNTVILKPASTAAMIAGRFVELLEQAGVPEGVVSFLPGPGGVVGDALVEHRLTRFISFTGSREVGLRINELAAKLQPGQVWIKRAILEMGGKDAILVDETSDLDAAATAIVASAFGFQGQKCSACSRAILVDSIYDQVLDRIVERSRQLTVGPTMDRSQYMGPVVDASAFSKVQEYIAIGKGEGKLLTGGGTLDRPGYFVEPTIFGEVAPTARIAQEEIFGPVLATIRVKDFDQGLAVANNTQYGLTGSLFSTDRARIERALREFHVGNLYINRKCTGAMVGGHPFGGFNMSGTDSKAGGHDYLLLFTQAKAISEKVG